MLACRSQGDPLNPLRTEDGEREVAGSHGVPGLVSDSAMAQVTKVGGPNPGGFIVGRGVNFPVHADHPNRFTMARIRKVAVESQLRTGDHDVCQYGRGHPIAVSMRAQALPECCGRTAREVASPVWDHQVESPVRRVGEVPQTAIGDITILVGAPCCRWGTC